MNILGYISAILILIGISFQSYYSNWFTDKNMQDSMKGYHAAFRSLEKEYTNQTFSSLPEKKEKNYSSYKVKNTAKLSQKLKKELTPYCMRLNLWIYKDVNLANSSDFSVLEKLISKLYKDKLLAEKDISKFTKNLIFAIQEKKQGSIHLEQLKFKSPDDQEIYYRMLKGQENLFPSFLNYATIKEDPNPKICVACADSIILASLFDEKTAKTLTQKKQSPLEQITIDKDLFDKIVLAYNTSKKYFPKLLLKHKKSALKEIVISSKEQTTQIKLNQKMPLNFKSSKKNNLVGKL